MLDVNALSQAVTYSQGLSFGSLQIPLNKIIPSELKPTFHAIGSTIVAVALYCVFQTTGLDATTLVDVVGLSLCAALGITGLVNLLKQPVKDATPQQAPQSQPQAVQPTAGI